MWLSLNSWNQSYINAIVTKRNGVSYSNKTAKKSETISIVNFSTFAHHYSSLSVTAHSLLLDHGCGTAYLKTSSLPPH